MSTRWRRGVAMWCCVLTLSAGALAASDQSGPRDPALLDAQLTDVATVGNARAWVVGDRGAIWHTTDGGSTWSSQTSGTGMNLADVTAVSTTTAYAVGSQVILKTTNGGTTWSKTTPPTGIVLAAVAAPSASVAWAAGASGSGGKWAGHDRERRLVCPDLGDHVRSTGGD